MDRLLDRIVAVTEQMQEALERDDLELCTVLLEERGRLLSEMAARGKNGSADPRWREAIARVHELDAGMAERLHAALSETARELSRLRRRQQGPLAEQPPRYINHKV